MWHNDGYSCLFLGPCGDAGTSNSALGGVVMSGALLSDHKDYRGNLSCLWLRSVKERRIEGNPPPRGGAVKRAFSAAQFPGL